WALLAALGSLRFSKVISCRVIWAASFGLKPRVTSFLARAAKLSESASTAGSPCTAQSCSWNLLEASRSEALLASLSVSIAGTGKVQPHREHAQPVRRVCDTHVSHL